MSVPPRILIVTAAFGEGHNSAARNLALALDAAGAITQVSDPCMLGVPRITRAVNSGYRYVTTNFPKIWAKIYRSTDNCDFSRQRSPVMRRVESRARRSDPRIPARPPWSAPTRFTRISSAASPRNREIDYPSSPSSPTPSRSTPPGFAPDCDRWLVTDPATRDAMIRKGLPVEKIVDTGFPVHPRFLQPHPG